MLLRTRRQTLPRTACIGRLCAGLLLAALSGPAVLSCRFLDSRRIIQVNLPELPENWRAVISVESYYLQWPGGGCTVAGGPGTGQKDGCIFLEVPAERYVPVLAYPQTEPAAGASSAGVLKPAGGVTSVPAGSCSTVSLRYEDGAPVHVLFGLAAGSWGSGNYQNFNVPRFLEEYAGRAGETPWRVDLVRLSTAAGFGSFRADLIRPMERFRLVLPDWFAPPGTWISGDPFEPPLKSVAGRGLEAELVFGEHWLFRAGSNQRIHLTADETGWHAVSTAAEGGLSGRW